MKTSRFAGVIAALCLVISMGALAQADKKAADAPAAPGLAGEEKMLKQWHDSPPPQCASKPFVFVSGSDKGTYSKIVKDIAKIPACAAFFCEAVTQGGYNNSLHLAHNYAEVGLVQVDGLDLVGSYDPHVYDLRSLVSLYPAAMHVVISSAGYKVRKEWNLTKDTVIPKGLSDLKGTPVAVWSSAVVTAKNLSDVNNLQLKLVTVTTVADGIRMLDKGEVTAFIGMGGRPVEWVSSLSRAYRLLPLTEQEVSAMIGKFPKSGYSKDSLIYDNLGQVGVTTVASQVEVVVQDFKGSRGTQLIGLRECILDNIDDMRESKGAHQSWKLVKTPEKTLWTAYTGPKKRERAAPVAQPAPAVVSAPAAPVKPAKK